MTKEDRRACELKLNVVAAEAASLADDLRNNQLWEDDCLMKLGQIQQALNDARLKVKKDT